MRPTTNPDRMELLVTPQVPADGELRAARSRDGGSTLHECNQTMLTTSAACHPQFSANRWLRNAAGWTLVVGPASGFAMAWLRLRNEPE